MRHGQLFTANFCCICSSVSRLHIHMYACRRWLTSHNTNYLRNAFCQIKCNCWFRTVKRIRIYVSCALVCACESPEWIYSFISFEIVCKRMNCTCICKHTPKMRFSCSLCHVEVQLRVLHLHCNMHGTHRNLHSALTRCMMQLYPFIIF